MNSGVGSEVLLKTKLFRPRVPAELVHRPTPFLRPFGGIAPNDCALYWRHERSASLGVLNTLYELHLPVNSVERLS